MKARPSFLTRSPGVCCPLQAEALGMVLWTRTELHALAQEIRTTTPTATGGATKGARIAEDAPHKAGAQEGTKLTGGPFLDEVRVFWFQGARMSSDLSLFITSIIRILVLLLFCG